MSFEHVRFGYEADRTLMHDVSFSVKPGQKVAIVGPTGAGKTTLVNLLMRFYEVDGGSIVVDGVPTRDMTRDDLRGRFGMVLQDIWLFEGTIRENLAYGRDGVTDEDVVRAAKAASVDSVIRTMPGGLRHSARFGSFQRQPRRTPAAHHRTGACGRSRGDDLG